MRGLTIHQQSENPDEKLSLLARTSDMEIMRQTIRKGATVWLSPSEKPGTFEFFFVLSGELRLLLKDASCVLRPGDSFSLDGINENIPIEPVQDTALLYVSNRPQFDGMADYQSKLKELMWLVDEKDHYTYRHSRNVMSYTVALARKMGTGQCETEDLVNASLFHDVGKFFIPDAILNKPGRLTDEEYEIVKQHPLDSARLLEPKFGRRVAEIARSHHERLDGSGYPLHLKGDQISPEGRIIAVADCFDTMTSRRVYTRQPKTFEEAARELASRPDLYDADVCRALTELVAAGDLIPAENTK